jgi:hypothetical protein
MSQDYIDAVRPLLDFVAGPVLTDPVIERPRRTWAFVMTLPFSRHQYLEFVFDRTVATRALTEVRDTRRLGARGLPSFQRTNKLSV